MAHRAKYIHYLALGRKSLPAIASEKDCGEEREGKEKKKGHLKINKQVTGIYVFHSGAL